MTNYLFKIMKALKINMIPAKENVTMRSNKMSLNQIIIFFRNIFSNALKIGIIPTKENVLMLLNQISLKQFVFMLNISRSSCQLIFSRYR